MPAAARAVSAPAEGSTHAMDVNARSCVPGRREPARRPDALLALQEEVPVVVRFLLVIDAESGCGQPGACLFQGWIVVVTALFAAFEVLAGNLARVGGRGQRAVMNLYRYVGRRLPLEHAG